MTCQSSSRHQNQALPPDLSVLRRKAEKRSMQRKRAAPCEEEKTEKKLKERDIRSTGIDGEIHLCHAAFEVF